MTDNNQFICIIGEGRRGLSVYYSSIDILRNIARLVSVDLIPEKNQVILELVIPDD